jgi:hypothetical protein
MVDPTLRSVPLEQVAALAELVKLCISDDPWRRPSVARDHWVLSGSVDPKE